MSPRKSRNRYAGSGKLEDKEEDEELLEEDTNIDEYDFAVGPELVRTQQHEWLMGWARVARDVSEYGVVCVSDLPVPN